MKPVILIALVTSLSSGKRKDLPIEPYSKFEVVGVCTVGGQGPKGTMQGVSFNYGGVRHLTRCNGLHPYGCAFVVEVDTHDFSSSRVLTNRPILEGRSGLSEVKVHSAFFFSWADIYYS